MTKEPWLEALSSDDWVSPSPLQSPHTSRPPSSVPNSARKCIGCTHQSRIPRLTESPSPAVKGKAFQKHSKSKSLGNVTPSPRPSPRLKNPVKGIADESSRPSSSSRKKGASSPSKQTPAKHRLHARSVSEISNNTVDGGTVQVRPEKGGNGYTPEWRKRLVHREMPEDEPCDLFAPLGIEAMFKHPPSKGPNEMISKSHTPPALPSAFKASGKASQSPEIVENSDRPSVAFESSSVASKFSRITTNTVQTTVTRGMDEPRPSEREAQIDSRNSIKISDQEVIRDEGITPIFLSETNTVDLRSASKVIKSALQKLTDEARSRSQSDLGNVPLDEATIGKESNGMHSFSAQGREMLPGDMLEVTSQSLPNDLSMGTQEMVSSYPFVNFRRGGYSLDDSFQNQRLSPSSLPSRTQFSSPNSASKIGSSPPSYDTANPFQDKHSVSPSMDRNSTVVENLTTDIQSLQRHRPSIKATGSPLKLFGEHDTFTSNKLLRRISQFEGHLDGTLETDGPPSPSPEVRRRRANRSLPNLRQGTTSPIINITQSQQNSEDVADPRINRFGNGQLDDYNFVDKLAHSIRVSQHTFSLRSQDNLRKSKSLDSISRRKGFFDSTTAPKPTHTYQKEQIGLGTPELPRQGLEVRPLLKTPGRAPEPKRRRTMHADGEGRAAVGQDMEFAVDHISEVQITQKNKPQLRSDVSGNSIEEMQRPRSPTPLESGAPWNKISSHELYSKNQDSTKIVDDMAVNMQDSRKASMSTQDYINEALKVMDILRANGKPTSGLESVNESRMEEDSNANSSYEDESSPENFSRPPSRDGVDIRKLRAKRELHPRVVSHLKKFADKEETDLGIGVSMMSLRLKGARERELQLQNTQDAVQSSPRNIRIRENSLIRRKRKHSRESDNEVLTGDEPANTNTRTSGSLNEQSIPTTSSNGSNTKGIIASEMVSHLIPEQVNGMTYDASTHTWVRKELEPSSHKLREGESEDDPFREISDLSVSESQEIVTLQPFISSSRKGHFLSRSRSPRESKLDSIGNPATAGNTNEIRPTTRDGLVSNTDSSSVHSKITRFTSSGPRPETRATSWGTEELTGNPTQLGKLEEKGSANDVVSETRLPNSHIQHSSVSSKQPRVVTIGFSSPLVSHIAYPEEADSANSNSKDIVDLEAECERGESMQHAYGKQTDKLWASAPVRRTSLDGRSFVGRPISRIDELNEDSPKELSLVRHSINGPLMSSPTSNRLARSLVRSPPPDPNRSYSFHLSSLPDFTVHQIDDPLQLEVSYVAQRTHPSSLRHVHGTFALAVEALVKHITDVEPYEPYWEYLRRLDLNGKGLITLHKLGEFCARLEELNVSNNQIGQLSGVPVTLRNLKIQHNCLSSLTAWGHLVNLQYLDVSGNDIENLDSFSGLMHLRELRANRNHIRNMEGVMNLDALLRLELRDNEITEVDFEGSELVRLSDLDLRNNQLVAVKNVGYLSALEQLNLSGNKLTTFGATRQLRSLRSLKVSDNTIHSLDVSRLQGIKLLYADRNRLSVITGLEECYDVEILSLREQHLADSTKNIVVDLDLTPLGSLRKMFLSSNRLTERVLAPISSAPSLQLLDVAACGLRELSPNFGRKFPNLRVVNLNFNAITDLRGLFGIHGLRRLTAVGNRISRLRRLCQSISQVSGGEPGCVASLKSIDLRGNPLTVGFYPPSVSGSRKGEGTILSRASKSGENTAWPQRSNNANKGRASTTAEHGTGIVESEQLNIRDTSSDDGGIPTEIEIDDPYTIPAADADADEKYRSHLDESTKTRRFVVQLMVFASTSGALQMMDGLDLRTVLESDRSKVDRVWGQLEALGVFRKKKEANGNGNGNGNRSAKSVLEVN